MGIGVLRWAVSLCISCSRLYAVVALASCRWYSWLLAISLDLSTLSFRLFSTSFAILCGSGGSVDLLFACSRAFIILLVW